LSEFPERRTERRKRGDAMPFVFWDGAADPNDATRNPEKQFYAALKGFFKNYGYQGCYPQARLEETWNNLRIWCRKSQTATNLLEYIDQAPQEVHVVGMRGGFQCFNSTAGLDGKKGTIFVDLDANTQILARTAHNLHLPRVKRLTLRYEGGESWVKLNNNVTLLHEIGHSRQWIEHPGWFDNDFRTETQKGDKRMKDISAKEIYLKARQMQQKTASGKGVQTRVMQGAPILTKDDLGVKAGGKYQAIGLHEEGQPAGARKPDLTFLPEVDEETGGQLLNPVGWSVPIEQDNMHRHEMPICREMGLPLRSNYADIKLGDPSPGAQQLNTVMQRMIKDEEDAASAKRAQEYAARKAAAGGFGGRRDAFAKLFGGGGKQ